MDTVNGVGDMLVVNAGVPVGIAVFVGSGLSHVAVEGIGPAFAHVAFASATVVVANLAVLVGTHELANSDNASSQTFISGEGDFLHGFCGFESSASIMSL